MIGTMVIGGASTQCREVTQCDFSTAQGVRRYIEAGGTARCSATAQSVAHKVQSMVAQRS
jgi:hypothetical protein